jgi:murein DD-endopeptidase MepM/ murein hydrolase activator NlpD
MIRVLAAAIFWAVLSSPAGAGGELSLEGVFEQGGVVLGKTDPNAIVRLAGRQLRLTEDGRFVFGFGRDFAESAELEVEFPDGRREQRTLTVAPRTYAIQRIDGLPPKKVSPLEEVWERIKQENAQIAAARAQDRALTGFLGPFQWPTEGIITGVYGSQRILNGQPKRPHYGIDIAAPEGAPVVAPAGGIVTLVASDYYYTGGTIIIDHGHGLTSAFLHMAEVSVEEGQTVQPGEVIGAVGATGRSTGPHLDWRINWFKERLDPAYFVPPMPAPVEGG